MSSILAPRRSSRVKAAPTRSYIDTTSLGVSEDEYIASESDDSEGEKENVHSNRGRKTGRFGHPAKKKKIDDGWSKEMMSRLTVARNCVDPMSSTFWDDVAAELGEGEKGGEECQEKWFRMVEEPKPKAKIKSKTTKGKKRVLSGGSPKPAKGRKLKKSKNSKNSKKSKNSENSKNSKNSKIANKKGENNNDDDDDYDDRAWEEEEEEHSGKENTEEDPMNVSSKNEDDMNNSTPIRLARAIAMSEADKNSKINDSNHSKVSNVSNDEGSCPNISHTSPSFHDTSSSTLFSGSFDFGSPFMAVDAGPSPKSQESEDESDSEDDMFSNREKIARPPGYKSYIAGLSKITAIGGNKKKKRKVPIKKRKGGGLGANGSKGGSNDVSLEYVRSKIDAVNESILGDNDDDIFYDSDGSSFDE